MLTSLLLKGVGENITIGKIMESKAIFNSSSLPVSIILYYYGDFYKCDIFLPVSSPVYQLPFNYR